MGTRGMFGFYMDGVTKAAYNHFDSYPEELGVKMLAVLRNTSLSHCIAAFKRIKMVSGDSAPTPEEIERCKPWTDLGVSNQSTSDWYCLLRKAQGNIDAYINGRLEYMLDGSDFINDSLFCEYAYIINLDEVGCFEAYEGGQRDPHSSGRYADWPGIDRYYPCKLIGSWSFLSLPSDDELVAAFGDTEE